MTGRKQVINLLQNVGRASCCPAHSAAPLMGATPRIVHKYGASTFTEPIKEYAFEMACSNIRYGYGVTQEVGMDFANMKSKKVGVYTDKNVAQLPAMKVAIDSLTKAGVNFEVYDDVRVEPTDTSFLKASNFAKQHQFDAFLAVGGGSVMDTCKAANLYMSDPDAEILDYVAKPIGLGKVVTCPLKPLIAIPTTSGTGSETTGTAVFDLEDMKAKVGISNRALRPLLGLVDPLHAQHMPERVAAFSGFDVLCHALESFTAIHYSERTPRPTNPIDRPAYQGSNPISDVWSLHALDIMKKYFARSVYDAEDEEARGQMHLASTFAGIGFGNAGVHLCHGLSYSIAGMVKKYNPDDYHRDFPIIPHGLSVVITAPRVFEFTAPMCPDRHLQGARALGGDITNAKADDAGAIISDVVRGFMETMKVPNGLSALGYDKTDIPGLVKGALPQERVNRLAPRPQVAEDLHGIYDKSMVVY